MCFSFSSQAPEANPSWFNLKMTKPYTSYTVCFLQWHYECDTKISIILSVRILGPRRSLRDAGASPKAVSEKDSLGA